MVSIEVTIEEDPSYHWQKMLVKITDDEGDVIYNFRDSLVSMRKKIAEKFNVDIDD